MLEVAAIGEDSVVDGPGLRTVVFFQGCRHHCKGCHNPQTWAFSGGTPYTPESLFQEVSKNNITRHITLSGGDPLYQSHFELFHFIHLLKEHGYDIIIYTGFSLEAIQEGFHSKAPEVRLLDNVIFVTDPFIESMKSLEVPFRGSKNQRVVKMLYTANDEIQWIDLSHEKEWSF